jgi:hypothetical protein
MSKILLVPSCTLILCVIPSRKGILLGDFQNYTVSDHLIDDIKTTRENIIIKIEVYENASFHLVAYHKKLRQTLGCSFLISRE